MSVLNQQTYLALPESEVRKLFEKMSDIDRGELILDLQVQKHRPMALAERLGYSARSLRAYRSLASESPDVKQTIRAKGIREIYVRSLRKNLPDHIPLKKILECYAVHRPSLHKITLWILRMKQEPSLGIERCLTAVSTKST